MLSAKMAAIVFRGKWVKASICWSVFHGYEMTKILEELFNHDNSKYGGKYVVMQYALRLTTAQISTFMCDLYPNDLV